MLLLRKSSTFLASLQVTYIAVMVRRMLYAMLDPSFIDDRDYYGAADANSCLLCALVSCVAHCCVVVCSSSEAINFGAALHAGNKRLELAGGLLALLFEDLFKRWAAVTYIAWLCWHA